MFLVLVVSLLLVRFQIVSFRPDFTRWGRVWWQFMESRLPADGFSQQGSVALWLSLILPSALLLLLMLILHAWGWHFLGYALALLVLVFCFDSVRLEADIASYVDDLERDDLQAAYHDARQLNAIEEESGAESFEQLRQETLGSASNRYFECYFPVFFWFVVLGIPGAVFYRTMHIFHGMVRDADQTVPPTLGRLKWILDWLPSRLFGLSLALAGNFSPVMGVLRQSVADPQQSISNLIQTFVSASIDREYAGDTQDTPTVEIHELRELAALMDRSLIVWVATAGIFAIL